MTNPPVPATPLDVEACMNPERLRNLADRILNMADGRADRDPASLRREAEFVRALASALPGMGKDSDGWKHASALSADLTGMAKARDAWREFGYHVAHCVECGQMMYTDCDDGNALHEAARAADDVLDHPIRSAARAAQPQETSDGR